MLHVEYLKVGNIFRTERPNYKFDMSLERCLRIALNGNSGSLILYFLRLFGLPFWFPGDRGGGEFGFI